MLIVWQRTEVTPPTTFALWKCARETIQTCVVLVLSTERKMRLVFLFRKLGTTGCPIQNALHYYDYIITIIMVLIVIGLFSSEYIVRLLPSIPIYLPTNSANVYIMICVLYMCIFTSRHEYKLYYVVNN